MDPRIEADSYDRGIIPAETAARKEREKEGFKQIPEEENGDSLDTSGGYTMDQEGLLNNYAVEPEMYYEVPGDAAQQAEADIAQRTEELKEINETDETGELTAEHDHRGRGAGII